MEGRQEEQQRMPAGRFYVEGIALAANAEVTLAVERRRVLVRLGSARRGDG
jgi:hypothetical protein